MQIVSKGDNMHEMLKPVFWNKNVKNVICWTLSAKRLNKNMLLVKTARAYIYT